ncbi:group III truncated hemoglobin [Oleiagrimonas sp.]|jgi:hemoglobin|uniref:group III truncated hemoglobin n=1 Tax=Oleiagrimonas sp. TaxID=2010330 RepID=UPI0026289247|nr:group III truncated hemoglobin [Oleiagrimonas sp.]MDA3914796.1 group III truncated hemoglobin [Oleiagrimonas sp.]
MIDEPSTPTGLTTDGIALLVKRFYARVRSHASLGPVFEASVTDWVAHEQRLITYWCWVALRVNYYRGKPMDMHRRLPIHANHFAQWLALWRQTANDVLDPASARHVIAVAERIGHGLRLGTLGPDAQAPPSRDVTA